MVPEKAALQSKEVAQRAIEIAFAILVKELIVGPFHLYMGSQRSILCVIEFIFLQGEMKKRARGYDKPGDEGKGFSFKTQAKRKKHRRSIPVTVQLIPLCRLRWL